MVKLSQADQQSGATSSMERIKLTDRKNYYAGHLAPHISSLLLGIISVGIVLISSQYVQAWISLGSQLPLDYYKRLILVFWLWDMPATIS